VDAVRARSALDNIDFNEPLRLGLGNRVIRSLREELLYIVSSSEKNLNDLYCNEILKVALLNKKKRIDEEQLNNKNQDTLMTFKEELILRILCDNRDVNNC